MAQVPSNLIPTRITQLPLAPVASENSILIIVYEGKSYQIRAGDLLEVAGVPISRQVIAGTGLTGGGTLASNVTLSVASKAIDNALLSDTGVTPGTYGTTTMVPVFTVDATGRVTAATSVPVTSSGGVPETRQVIAGVGLNGGGALNTNVTLNANLSTATPLPGDQAGHAGTSNNIARADHQHPAVDLSNDEEVDNILNLSNGGTARSLVMNPGAVIWSGSDGLYVGPAGVAGQVLASTGTGAPTWVNVTTNYPQPAHYVFIGPVSGPNAQPTYRLLVNDDLPAALTGKTYNGLNLTSETTGFSITGGTTSKTLTIQNSLTLAGTDGVTTTLPSSPGTVALNNQQFYLGTTQIAINRSSGALTLNGVSVDGSAGSASNISGGLANQIAFQTAPSTTSFITAPTSANTYLEWSGSAFQWSSNPLGTVTSVDVSGGTTGITTSGGPITTSGTITLGGTLAVTNGGTGATNSADARANLSAAVLGANNDITSMTGLTGGISSPDYVQFDATATVTDATAKLYYDKNDQYATLSFQMNGSTVQKIGEEQYYRIKCSSAVTKGQVVMFTGTLGASGGLTGAPATGLTADEANYILGVAIETGNTNDWIFVTSFGEVKGINTTGGAESWVQGQVLYYNPSVTGGLTKTKPVTPNAIAVMAAVVHVSASNGILFVRPTFGSVLGGTDGNVQFSTLANGDVIVYDGVDQRWENRTQSSLSVGTATNLAGGSANQIAYQTGAGATSFVTAPTIANTYLEWSGSAFQWSTNPLGTVTSVALSAPTGFSVSGSPVITNGTLALSFASGYSLPTDASQSNWNTAYSERLQWDGGSTNLTAATGRTSLGGTTVGQNFFTLTNPSAVTFPRINADNSVSALDAATFRSEIGAGTGNGTVTSVGLSLPAEFSISGSPVVSSGTLTGTWASQTQNYFFAAPNGSAGTPTFRAIVAADVPTLNQNTTGSAGSVAHAVTFNSSGGASAGTTFDGSVARTIDYSTVGAPKTDGTGASGTWSIDISGNASTATTTTNIAGGAAGSIPYQTGSGATSLLAAGSGVLVGGSTPSYSTAPSLTGTNFTSIPNGALTNSSVTLGTTSVSLGATSLTLGGLTSVTLTQDPVSNLQAATKQYVDTLVASGITYHAPVKYEVPHTTGNLTATYNNGSSGVGATLTNAGTLAAFTPDGTVASVGDRILIYNQTNAYENGVYTVTTVGSGSVAWVLTRATDADSYGLKNPNALGEGDAFFVQSGNVGAGETYVCNTSGTITFGTTNITFVQVSDTQIYSAGTGLTLTGTQFSLTVPVTAVTGGTGQTSYAAGDVLYASSSTALSKLAIGASARILTSSGSAPQWSDPSGITVGTATTANNVSGTVAIANGGTGQTTATAAFDALAPTTTKGDLIVSDGTDNVRLAVGANGTVLTADSTAATGVKWTAAGAGTVTSVALALPAEFTISGSPVTSSGTLTGAWANAATNSVFAGPATGSAATPTFRALVDADIPAALTGKTYNALTLTSNATGFQIAGGTASKTMVFTNSITLGGTDSTTITLPATSGTVALDSQQFYLGTTQIAINRTSASISLTGVSIDGSAGSATNANNVAVTDDTSTNATMYPVWVTANTGNLPAKVTSSKLSFNPSTGAMTVTGGIGGGTF